MRKLEILINKLIKLKAASRDGYSKKILYETIGFLMEYKTLLEKVGSAEHDKRFAADDRQKRAESVQTASASDEPRF